MNLFFLSGCETPGERGWTAPPLADMVCREESQRRAWVCGKSWLSNSLYGLQHCFPGSCWWGKDTEVDGQWSVTNPHRFTLGDFRVSEEIAYFILCQASLQTWTEWVFLGYQINLPALLSHPEKWEQFCTDLADVFTMAREKSSLLPTPIGSNVTESKTVFKVFGSFSRFSASKTIFFMHKSK